MYLFLVIVAVYFRGCVNAESLWLHRGNVFCIFVHTFDLFSCAKILVCYPIFANRFLEVEPHPISGGLHTDERVTAFFEASKDVVRNRVIIVVTVRIRRG